MAGSYTAREVIRGLFIGLTVACWGLTLGGPMLGFSTGSSLLWIAGWLALWLAGSVLLALVKVIVF